jgi:uncharacterized membrane protein YqaE (UPF0057 family)
MRYVLACLAPPVAIRIYARGGPVILNCFLCLPYWVPAVIHALVVTLPKQESAEESMAEPQPAQPELSGDGPQVSFAHVDREAFEAAIEKQNCGPTASDLSFRTWYGRTIGRLPVPFQVLAWVFPPGLIPLVGWLSFAVPAFLHSLPTAADSAGGRATATYSSRGTWVDAHYRNGRLIRGHWRRL